MPADSARHPDAAAAAVAAAIGEPSRARMLYTLLDGRARTATELAVLAGIGPSTASVHLHRLAAEGLVQGLAQGKHRYFTLSGTGVAQVLESLSALAGGGSPRFAPRAPERLRAARTCYDHIAGSLGVALLDRQLALGWLVENGMREYNVTATGDRALRALGLDPDQARARRRRFAVACLDWSERRVHLGGALGAAWLDLARRQRWVAAELDSRALAVTARGRRALDRSLGLRLDGG
ncbi:MAG TPA: winged helix-turn-helix domain-containing protein [Terriglobales bacterium]|nr:winged helix-turn-helix domain-containing protein [Terriglobales bacterium]